MRAHGLRAVEQDDAVAGEVRAGLGCEGARDDAALETGSLDGGGDRAARGGSGDAFAGGEPVAQAAGSVRNGQDGLDVDTTRQIPTAPNKVAEPFR
ncbi:hypothetical protein ACFW9N_42375 [Streptomyces sp. NPDC059496]|uniref:hypothetical protein n=1 Tax=Streptomyces sp. NPDC059496 TaxID=3346851 RepID=UPI0036CB5EF8